MMARPKNQALVVGWRARPPATDDPDPGFTGREADVSIAQERVGVEWPEHPGMATDPWGAIYGRHTRQHGYDS